MPQREVCGYHQGDNIEECTYCGWPKRKHPLGLCSGGCGLPSAPGDIYCNGCREGHDRELVTADA